MLLPFGGGGNSKFTFYSKTFLRDVRVFVGESCIVSNLDLWGPLYEHFIRALINDTWVSGEVYLHGFEKGNVALSEYSQMLRNIGPIPDVEYVSRLSE